MFYQELMSHWRWQRSMKLTLPTGCYHNTNPSLNIFHIRKVLPCYLKPYADCVWCQTTMMEVFLGCCGQLSLLLSYVAIKRALYSPKGCTEALDKHIPKGILLCKRKNDVYQNLKCHDVMWIVMELSFMLLRQIISSWFQSWVSKIMHMYLIIMDWITQF